MFRKLQSLNISLLDISLYFWCAALFFITFDRALVLEIAGFSIKTAYFCFLVSALLIFQNQIQKKNLKDFFKRSLNCLRSSPWCYFVYLIFFASLTAPFTYIPKKAIAYTLWAYFDIIVISLGSFWLFYLCNQKDKLKTQRSILYTLCVSNIFLTTILVIDFIAYFYGYKHGLIGFNQDGLTQRGISRPHAFSHEPSYLATFLSIASSYTFFSIFSANKIKIKRWLPIIASFFGLIGLIITFSRTALAATFLIFFFFLLFRFLKSQKLPSIPKKVLIGILVTPIFLWLLLPIKHRELIYEKSVVSIINKTDISANARVQSLINAYILAKETNYLGSGIGNSFASWVRFRKVHLNFAIQKGWSWGGRDNHSPILKPEQYGYQFVMSLWGEALAEFGIVGITLFGFFVFSFLYKLFLINRRSKVNNIFFEISFCTAFVFFTFTSHWLPNLYRPDVWIWFAIWGTQLNPLEENIS